MKNQMRKFSPKNDMELFSNDAFPPEKGKKGAKGKAMPFKKGKKY